MEKRLSETDNPVMTHGASSNMDMQGLIPGAGEQVRQDAIEKNTVSEMNRRTE